MNTNVNAGPLLVSAPGPVVVPESVSISVSAARTVCWNQRKIGFYSDSDFKVAIDQVK